MACGDIIMGYDGLLKTIKFDIKLFKKKIKIGVITSFFGLTIWIICCGILKWHFIITWLISAPLTIIFQYLLDGKFGYRNQSGKQ